MFIGLAVVVFFIVRQFTTRPVASWWMVVVPATLAVFGVQDLPKHAIRHGLAE